MVVEGNQPKQPAPNSVPKTTKRMEMKPLTANSVAMTAKQIDGQSENPYIYLYSASAKHTRLTQFVEKLSYRSHK